MTYDEQHSNPGAGGSPLTHARLLLLFFTDPEGVGIVGWSGTHAGRGTTYGPCQGANGN